MSPGGRLHFSRRALTHMRNVLIAGACGGAWALGVHRPTIGFSLLLATGLATAAWMLLPRPQADEEEGTH